MRQTSECGNRQGRDRIQTRVWSPVCGQNGHGDALALGQRHHLLHAVFPIGHATDQADQNALGPRQRVVDVGINRQRMP